MKELDSYLNKLKFWEIEKSSINSKQKKEQVNDLVKQVNDLVKQVNDLVKDIVNIIFMQVSDIQKMKEGWSADSKLKIEEQYWLDPYRKDSGFQMERQTSKLEWEEEDC